MTMDSTMGRFMDELRHTLLWPMRLFSAGAFDNYSHENAYLNCASCVETKSSYFYFQTMNNSCFEESS